MLTKVRQLCGNQKLTANCYQKLTANRYQKLTAKCNQKFQSKVDSEIAIKSFSQKVDSELLPKVDSEIYQKLIPIKSFSQKLTAKCNAKIVREVALRYCKQINHGRYQCNTRPLVSPAKDRSIKRRPQTHHSQAQVQLDDAVNNVIDYFSLFNRWMHDYK